MALGQSRGEVGRVVNVFERTINVLTTQDELLVITLDRTKSPANLNVNALLDSQARFLGLARQGQEVIASRAGERTVVYVGELIVFIDEPDVFQCFLKEPVAGFLQTFAAEVDDISSALAGVAAKREGCLLNPDMTTEGLLATFLGRLKTRGARNQYALTEALAGLCGRGPGFTPAGDDFIAGYLAAYNWLGRALKQWPPVIPGREFSRLTTWTSFKLMEYASKGLLDEQAQSMLNSVAGGDVGDCIRCIEVIGRRGHTSGIDFATGAMIGVCAAADGVFELDALERISNDLARKPAQLS